MLSGVLGLMLRNTRKARPFGSPVSGKRLVTICRMYDRRVEGVSRAYIRAFQIMSNGRASVGGSCGGS